MKKKYKFKSPGSLIAENAKLKNELSASAASYDMMERNAKHMVHSWSIERQRAEKAETTIAEREAEIIRLKAKLYDMMVSA